MSSEKLADLLCQLGFTCKPWRNHSDVWWFDGYPLITLSSLKNPRDIVKTLLVTLTPEAMPLSDSIKEPERKEIVTKLIREFVNR